MSGTISGLMYLLVFILFQINYTKFHNERITFVEYTSLEYGLPAPNSGYNGFIRESSKFLIWCGSMVTEISIERVNLPIFNVTCTTSRCVCNLSPHKFHGSNYCG